MKDYYSELKAYFLRKYPSQVHKLESIKDDQVKLIKLYNFWKRSGDLSEIKVNDPLVPKLPGFTITTDYGGHEAEFGGEELLSLLIEAAQFAKSDGQFIQYITNSVTNERSALSPGNQLSLLNWYKRWGKSKFTNEIVVNDPLGKPKYSPDIWGKLPLLNLTIGKYDVDKGQRGYSRGYSAFKRYIHSSTLKRILNICHKLGIVPKKVYFGWHGPHTHKSTYVLAYYGDEPIIFAQRQTSGPAAGQFYMFSQYKKSGKALRLGSDNVGIFADVNATKEEILNFFEIDPNINEIVVNDPTSPVIKHQDIADKAIDLWKSKGKKSDELIPDSDMNILSYIYNRIIQKDKDLKGSKTLRSISKYVDERFPINENKKMKKSELKSHIKENIIEILSETDDEGVVATDDISKAKELADDGVNVSLKEDEIEEISLFNKKPKLKSIPQNLITKISSMLPSTDLRNHGPLSKIEYDESKDQLIFTHGPRAAGGSRENPRDAVEGGHTWIKGSGKEFLKKAIRPGQLPHDLAETDDSMGVENAPHIDGEPTIRISAPESNGFENFVDQLVDELPKLGININWDPSLAGTNEIGIIASINKGSSMNEGSSDLGDFELELAKEEAQQISGDEGVSQHVNNLGNGNYAVEDWFDSETTVFTYINGELDRSYPKNLSNDGDLNEMARIASPLTIADMDKATLLKQELMGKTTGQWIVAMIDAVAEAGEAGILQPDLATAIGKGSQQSINPTVRKFIEAGIFTKGGYETAASKALAEPLPDVPVTDTEPEITPVKTAPKKTSSPEKDVTNITNEPTGKELTKPSGESGIQDKMVKLQGELKRITKDMKDLAIEYKEANETDQGDILKVLKSKTNTRKEIESQIKKINKDLLSVDDED